MSVPSRSAAPPLPTPTPFPYTTLFRSAAAIEPGRSHLPDQRRRNDHRDDRTEPTRNPPRHGAPSPSAARLGRTPRGGIRTTTGRSEEHTSELLSRFDLVCRLLLEKKKN